MSQRAYRFVRILCFSFLFVIQFTGAQQMQAALAENGASPLTKSGNTGTAAAKNLISLATFNIRVFTDRSRDDKELADICQLLSPYDLIFVQETRDLQVLERTVHMLKSHFGFSFSFVAAKPVGRGGPEIYAWLFRSDLLKPIGDVVMYPDPGDRFIREPAFQAFKVIPKDGEIAGFDFLAIDIHAIYGDNTTVRRAEASRLGDVYDWALRQAVTRFFGTGSKERDIVLAGDFNLPCTDTAFDNLRHRGMTPVNAKALPTTIADSAFDNIWIVPEYTKEFTGIWGIDRFDETMFDGDDKKASLAVSDHRPTWAKFTEGPDDD